MSLEHPNVVPIHDAGDIDGRLYLAMRYVEGTDLRAASSQEGVLQQARAPCHLRPGRERPRCGTRERGLVHRDVKPSNVLLDENEHVYLADFGLTRRLDEQGDPAGESRSVGTPAYLAPEQIEGGQIDGRTDVYCSAASLPVLGRCAPLRRIAARSRLGASGGGAAQRTGALAPRVARSDRRGDPQGDGQGARAPHETCGALIAAAEQALGLRRSRPLRRRAVLLLVGALLFAAFSAAAIAAVFCNSRSPWSTVGRTPVRRGRTRSPGSIPRRTG